MKKYPLIFGYILSIIFLLTISGNSQESIEKYLREAQSCYNTALFNESINLCNKVMEMQGLSQEQRVDAYRLKGFALVANGKTDQAKAAIKKVIELAPDTKFDPDYVPPKMMRIYYQAWQDINGSNQIEQRKDPGVTTMAVLDFDNNSIGSDKEGWEPMGKGLAQMLITDLSKIVKLKVIERERIQYILNELKLEQDQAFNQETAVRIGQQLGVHSMLFGGFSKIGKTMRIDARLIKVETSELIKAEEITGKADDFLTLEKELALKIAKNLKVPVTTDEVKVIKKVQNRSLEAALAYSEGLSLLDKEDYKQAKKKFEEALKFNPNYAAAQKKLDLIKDFSS